MRHIKINVPGVLTPTAMIAMVLACSGCYEELDSAPQAQTAQQPGGAPAGAGGSHPMDSQVSQGGGSALGSAKRSAEKTADRVEEYNRQISEAADDALSDD